jgi:hypothetical protein
MKFGVTILVLGGTLLCCSAGEVGGPPAKIQFMSPLNYEVVQSAEGKGEIRVIVSVTPATVVTQAGVRVEARITGPGLAGEWFRVPSAAEQNSFRAERMTPAGGWYRVEARVLVDGANAADAFVEHVGVGEIFVVAGQSNSANYGEERQETQTGLVAAFDGVKWQPARDPEPGAGGAKGSFMAVFGDELARRLKVPVGVVAMGIGSTSVREWLPAGTHFPQPPTITRNVVERGTNDWEAVGKIYSNFVARLKGFGPQGFRAVLWHQGESDANQAAGRTLSGELYRKYLTQLIQDSRRDAGWDIPWFVAQATYHNPQDTGSADIRAAQRALWESGLALPGPDTDKLTGDMREKNGMGVHFSVKGLQEHGKMWADRVVPWLTKQP